MRSEHNENILGTFWCLFLVSCKRTLYRYPALGRGLLFGREIGDCGGRILLTWSLGSWTQTQGGRGPGCVFSPGQRGRAQGLKVLKVVLVVQTMAVGYAVQRHDKTILCRM